jgi:hypothetical protein
LDALRTTARTKISLYLDNTSDIIDEDTGYVTDWNGLAELIGFNNLELKKFGRQKSPTKDLLDDWESYYATDAAPNIVGIRLVKHFLPCISSLIQSR